MTDRKRKLLYWLFKFGSIVVSCALPIWAICERFPLWTESHGTSHSIGVGVILIAIVVLIVFRKTVFDFIRDHLNLKHAPPITIWLILLVASYILIYIGDFMRDMTTILWMGFVGCCIGTFLTYLSERFKKEVTTDE